MQPVLAFADHGRDGRDAGLNLGGLVVARKQAAPASSDHQQVRFVATDEFPDGRCHLSPRRERVSGAGYLEARCQVEQRPPEVPGRADGLLAARPASRVDQDNRVGEADAAPCPGRELRAPQLVQRGAADRPAARGCDWTVLLPESPRKDQVNGQLGRERRQRCQGVNAGLAAGQDGDARAGDGPGRLGTARPGRLAGAQPSAQIGAKVVDEVVAEFGRRLPFWPERGSTSPRPRQAGPRTCSR
jgi:hypothetical protein